MKFILAIVLSVPFFIFSQKHSIDSYKSSLNNISYNFKSNVKNEDYWEDEEKNISSLIEDADEDLKSGSGLTFSEMNELRIIKKYLRALQVVGESINPSNDSHFNKRSLKYVQELVSGISLEFLFTELNVNVYRLRLDNYYVYLFYYSDGSYTMRTIGWKLLNEMRCGSIMGKLTVLSGVYKQFWNNSECLNKSNFKFKVLENTFLMSTQEYIYNDKPYTE
jgi:hypothetical protein